MKQITLIMTIFCAFLFSSGCIKDKVEGVELKVGERLPKFSVVMSDGSHVSDESLMGSVSCIMFFHTSCPDCQRTLPVVQQVYDEYAQNGVLFAIMSREQTSRSVRTFWAQEKLDMPFSAQSDRTVYNKFAHSRIPRVYICDKDGIIRYIYTDDPTPTYENLNDSISSLLVD